MGSASDQTYWILEEHQLRVMASARRHDIVDRLVANGPMSVRELAGQIGAQPSALYHHMTKLLAAGLVVEAGSRPVGKRREQVYRTVAPRMRLARALSDNQHPDIVGEIVNALTRQMARDFQSGLALPIRIAEGEGRNIGFARLVGRPSPDALARINACLADISEYLWEAPREGDNLVTFGWVMAPAIESAD
jgi:DNA-binding transcriptional ArsR family regulator